METYPLTRAVFASAVSRARLMSRDDLPATLSGEPHMRTDFLLLFGWFVVLEAAKLMACIYAAHRASDNAQLLRNRKMRDSLYWLIVISLTLLAVWTG